MEIPETVAILMYLLLQCLLVTAPFCICNLVLEVDTCHAVSHCHVAGCRCHRQDFG